MRFIKPPCPLCNGEMQIDPLRDGWVCYRGHDGWGDTFVGADGWLRAPDYAAEMQREDGTRYWVDGDAEHELSWRRVTAD